MTATILTRPTAVTQQAIHQGASRALALTHLFVISLDIDAPLTAERTTSLFERIDHAADAARDGLDALWSGPATLDDGPLLAAKELLGLIADALWRHQSEGAPAPRLAALATTARLAEEHLTAFMAQPGAQASIG